MLSLIVAVSKNGVIGEKGKIPWHIPEDLKRFKKLTMGHHIIMGRKTFESIGKPLRGRHSIILSRKPDHHHEGCLVVNSLEEALEHCVRQKDDEAFVIGGEAVFQEALFSDLIDKIYLTQIKREYKGDTRFSGFDESRFQLKKEEHHKEYSFLDYIRR